MWEGVCSDWERPMKLFLRDSRMERPNSSRFSVRMVICWLFQGVFCDMALTPAAFCRCAFIHGH